MFILQSYLIIYYGEGTLAPFSIFFLFVYTQE
nr:MAG TPA: hypothetical protein [Caudoviricetes sp.]